MTITDADLIFDYSHPESIATVRTRAGDLYRVTLINDDDAQAPDGDYGLPTFILERDRHYGGAKLEDVRDNYHTDYGSHAARHDGMTRTLTEVFDYFHEQHDTNMALSMTARWLRVFHNGGIVVSYAHPYRDQVVLVSYWTERMVMDAFGFTTTTYPGPDTWDTEHDEWKAYFEGEVYGIRVEVDDNAAWGDEDDASWHELNACWGYYGESHAVDEALSTINHHARPLGGLRKSA